MLLGSKGLPSDCAAFTVGVAAEVLINGDDEVRYPAWDWRLTRGGGVAADLMIIDRCQRENMIVGRQLTSCKQTISIANRPAI